VTGVEVAAGDEAGLPWLDILVLVVVDEVGLAL